MARSGEIWIIRNLGRFPFGALRVSTPLPLRLRSGLKAYALEMTQPSAFIIYDWYKTIQKKLYSTVFSPYRVMQKV